eukprot:tig00000789_g4095.t1
MPVECPICISRLTHGDISALPCGHVFHGACVLQALETTKCCPHCRMKCGGPPEPGVTQAQLAALQSRLRDYEATVASLRDAVRQGQELRAKAESQVQTASAKADQFKQDLKASLEELKSSKRQAESLQRKLKEADEKLARLHAQVESSEYIKQVVEGREGQAPRRPRTSPENVELLETLVATLKREVKKLKGQARDAHDEAQEERAKVEARIRKYVEELDEARGKEADHRLRITALERQLAAALKAGGAAGPRWAAPPRPRGPRLPRRPRPASGGGAEAGAGARGEVVDLESEEGWEEGASEGEGQGGFLRRGAAPAAYAEGPDEEGPRPRRSPAPRRPTPAPAGGSTQPPQFENRGVYTTGYSGTGARVKAYTSARPAQAGRPGASGAQGPAKRRRLGAGGIQQPIGAFFSKTS